MATTEGLRHMLVVPATQWADPGWRGKMENSSSCQSHFAPGTYSSFHCAESGAFTSIWWRKKMSLNSESCRWKIAPWPALPCCLLLDSFEQSEVLLNDLEQLPFLDWLCLSVFFCWTVSVIIVVELRALHCIWHLTITQSQGLQR